MHNCNQCKSLNSLQFVSKTFSNRKKVLSYEENESLYIRKKTWLCWETSISLCFDFKKMLKNFKNMIQKNPTILVKLNIKNITNYVSLSNAS